jgi:phosphatidylserine/phosphatidylglycerophosphate/cardiolipin synthase-like enzyme
MRFKSKKTGGYQVFAVTGTNTVSFGIDFAGADTKGLLGFALERSDPAEKQKFFTFGFKVFPSVIPHPDEDTSVKTFDHPVQAFVTDDFTAKPDREYEYIFHPLKGAPKNLDRSATPISIKVRTEPLFSKLEHDIFFNRGVASSQAYNRKFQNKRPDDPTLPAAKQAEARQWLSRDLDEAMLRFIDNAKKGETLLCCFYEFRYPPIAEALKAALAPKRGVNVRIIVDGKNNKPKDKKGKLQPPFPRAANLKMIKDAGLPKKNIILREARTSNIQHNKFMVLLKGKRQVPSEVWTGSTNISDGGIHGQTNVGHWVRDKDVAAKFKDYWDLLSADPGGTDDDDAATVRSRNKTYKADVEAILDVPTALDDIESGITPVFSPRNGPDILQMYAGMVADAKKLSCITLAFGISAEFKKLLKKNRKSSHIAFFLLEKEDKPNKRAKDPFVTLNASNNVYKAWGSFLREPLYQWTKEVNAQILQLNTHVSYIHSKVLLRDPLGKDPVVVTGSANFSKASTNDNDENMLIIRGNQRVADIYFTEFNRLFYHYYFRSVQEQTNKMLSEDEKRRSDEQTLFLSESDDWVKKYRPGSLKQKRIDIFRNMDGFQP